MLCPQCNFICDCMLWHSNQCFEDHALFHKKYLDVLNEYKDYESDRSHTQSIFAKSQKRCASCEEPINGTSHVCKGKDKAIEVEYLLRDIFKRGDPQ